MTMPNFYSNYYGEPVIHGGEYSFTISVIHDNRGHGEDSSAISLGKSKGKIDYIDYIDSKDNKLNKEDLTDYGERYTALPYQNRNEFISSIVASVDGKSSLKVTPAEYAGAYMCVTTVDGATSALIDGTKDPTMLDASGNPTPIADELVAATRVSSFSKSLSRVYDTNTRTNPSANSIELLKMTIRDIAASEPYANANMNKDIVPTATFASVRENSDGNLELLVVGDQTAIIAYTDGTHDLITADKGIKALEEERKKYIAEHYPDYNKLPKNQQKLIRMGVMKTIQRPMNGKTYYAPYPEKEGVIQRFMDQHYSQEVDDRRSITKYGNNDDIVHVVADKKKVASVIISTDGFLERALKTKIKRNGVEQYLATPYDFIAADGQELSRIKRNLRSVEERNDKSHDDETLVKIDVTPLPKRHFKAYASGAQNASSKKEFAYVNKVDPRVIRRRQQLRD